MSTAGQKEVLGAIEIVVGEVINYYTGGTGGSWLVQLGVETMVAGGLQELANLLAPSPMPAAQNGIVRSTVAAQQRIYGQVKTGGVIVFSDAYGSNNENLVVAVNHTVTRSTGSAGMPVAAINGFYVNDIFIPINTGSGGWNSSDGSITAGSPGAAWNGLAGNLWIYFYDGSQTTVDSTLHTNFVYWPSTAVGKGNCYSVFKMFNSSDQATFQAAYPQGIPSMLGAVISGSKVYDPRLDSTNGGSGSQRLANSSTWTFSSNPALIAADYLTTPKTDGGCGYATSQINWAAVAAAANTCDVNITLPAYGATWSGSAWSSTVTQAQYTCNVALDLSQDCDQNLRVILDCMAGVVVVAGNQISIYAGASSASSGSFDETFLAGPIALTTETPRQSRWNAVKSTYGQDPSCDYQQQEGATIFNSTYETQDGARLLKSITLPGVNNQFAAQYLQCIESQRSRNYQQISAKCNLKMLQYQCWDIVSVTIAEYGLSSAPFRIIQFTLNSDLSIDVIMQAEAAGTYSVALGGQLTAFNPPSLTTSAAAPGGNPPAPSSPAANAVAGGILVTWTPPAAILYKYIEVWRAPDVSGSPGTYSLLQKVVGDSYLDGTARATNKLWYKMRAVNLWLQDSAYTSGVSSTGLTAKTSADGVAGATGQNLCQNGNFETSTSMNTLGAPVGWTNGAGPPNNPVGTPSAIVYETSTPYDGAQTLHFTATAQYQGVGQDKSFAVTPGDWFYVACAMKTGGGTQQGRFQFVFYDKTGATTGTVNLDTTVGQTSYAAQTGKGHVPANSVIGYITCSNINAGAADIYVDDCVVLRMANLSNTDVATIGSIPPTNPTTIFNANMWSTQPTRVSSHTYTIGNIITVSGRSFVSTQNGTSASSAPSFNLALGATTLDGTVTWTCCGTQTIGPCATIWATSSIFTRADGTTVTLPRQIFALYGLTGGTTLFPYLGYDEVLQDVFMYGTDGAGTSMKGEYTGGLNGNQSGTAVYTSRSSAINAAVLQNAQTVVALTISGNLTIPIPSSGTTSTSGGGYSNAIAGGYCPHERQLVHTDQGDIPAIELLDRHEAKVWTRDGYVTPLLVQADPHERWAKVTIKNAAGQRIEERVTERHSYIAHDGSLISIEDMRMGTVLCGDGGGFCEVVGLEVFQEEARAVAIELPEPHTFYITRGGAESHNPLTKP